MRANVLFLVALVTLYPTFSARAHEFWISPEDYTLDPGAPIIAQLRVGQDFKGGGYAFLPNLISRFEIVTPDGTLPVAGRMGDLPALTASVPGEGLAVIVHETTTTRLTYTDWEKFVAFVTHKDLAGTLEAHAERGLPQTGFTETYSRHAKSLVALGTGEGADRESGFVTEIVALANPYTDELSAGLPVRVLYQGKPRVDAQVEVFARAPDLEVTVTMLRTDAAGVAVVPVAAGVEYLIDAVVMRPLPEGDATGGPVWESLWASLTFMMPPTP